MMVCLKCSYPISHFIAHEIEVIDGYCTSSCDDVVVIHVNCPSCGFRVFAKTVDQPYATWAQDRYPSWVKISPFRQVESDDDTLFIAAKPDGLYLYQRQDTIYGTSDQELPNCDDGAELYISQDGSWHIWFPPVELGRVDA